MLKTSQRLRTYASSGTPVVWEFTPAMANEIADLLEMAEGAEATFAKARRGAFRVGVLTGLAICVAAMLGTLLIIILTVGGAQ